MSVVGLGYISISESTDRLLTDKGEQFIAVPVCSEKTPFEMLQLNQVPPEPDCHVFKSNVLLPVLSPLIW